MDKEKITETEKHEISMEIARAYRDLESLAIEKNKAIAEFDNRKEKLREKIRLLSQKVKEGITI